jgi:hypothetical protein
LATRVGGKRRRPDERDYLCELFIRMLLHSEKRGPHASGLAWPKTDGNERKGTLPEGVNA